METESQPSLHFRTVLFVFVMAETVLCIEVRENTLEKVKETFWVLFLLLHVLCILSLFLNPKNATYASVA